MFTDVAKIKIKAGDGGDGAVAFHREKYVNAGGPDGGDGGRGGDVIFEVNDNLSTLADFRYKTKYVAKNGMPGEGNKRGGKSAPDLIIKVPRGTLIKEAESGAIMADMRSIERFTAAKGGRGGFGNQHFATPTRQAPRFAKPGAPGESWDIILELKLLADVGLIGYPSVGKSSLIAVMSNAKPKIADYHFTTLSPNLGVVSVEEGTSFVVADIPGIIEGASEGAGLGIEFLRHIERCRLLVHLVDVSGFEGRDPKDDFIKINNELKNFNADLAERPQIVVGNKIDLATEEQVEDFKNWVEEKGYKFFPICAPISEGTEELTNAIAEALSQLPPVKEYAAEQIPLESMVKDIENFTVTCPEPGYFIVEAPWFPKVLKGLDVEDYESLQYLQGVLERSGINQRLIEMGIKEGDTVSIYDIEFDYIP